jgi:hypothetical protein
LGDCLLGYNPGIVDDCWLSECYDQLN